MKNEAKEEKGEFISMLLGTLGGSLLGNMLTGQRSYKGQEKELLELAVDSKRSSCLKKFDSTTSFNKL